jgi:kynurenine formamidase
MTTRLIDLSHPLDAATLPWPGNPGVDVDVLSAIPPEWGPGRRAGPAEPVICNATAFRTCNHTGTHMDSPAHFYNGVPTIEQVPLDHCVGPAALVDVSHIGARGVITPADLIAHKDRISTNRKVVLRTGWSSRWGEDDYFSDYPVLSEEAAGWLIERRVHLLGVDTPSPDCEPHAVHYILLGAHAVIVENLTRLDLIKSPTFELIVLPLPLGGLEASPVRAVARVEE